MKKETTRRIFAVLLPAVLLVLTTNPAFPCVAAFGYTGSGVDNINSITANVDVGTAYLDAADEVMRDQPKYIVPDVEYLRVKAGPVFILLQNLIFDPNAKTVDCTGYERGSSSEMVTSTNFRGAYRDKLDEFFALNADIFKGTARKVYSLVIHSEANNSCVPNWKLNSAAQYVESKLAEIAEYGPIYTSVGYAFRNTDEIANRGPIVSKGFPVANKKISKFPYQVDMIGYWIYDIFDPNIPSHSFNKNQESWTLLKSNLDQALNVGQKTAIIVKAFCNDRDPIEAAWGVTCPSSAYPLGLSTWKIGIAAKNWQKYALTDSRNLFMLGFHWPNFGTSIGAGNLPETWSRHSEIQQQVNCTVP